MLVKYLFFLLTVTIFAIASTILTIYNYDPFQSGAVVFIDFYTSFGIALTGIIAISIYWAKAVIFPKSVAYRFWSSLRQSLLVAVGITAILALQQFRILDWLIGSSIVIVVILLELFFQTKKGKVK